MTNWYYLDNPDLENPPTVTLASLKARIATVTNMVDASIAGHKNCLVAKLISERDGRPRLPDFFHEGTKDMNSGQPANSVIYEWNGSDSNGYVNHIVDGPDGDLFSWPNSDHDSDYSNGYTETLVTNRPLPRGQYVIHTVRQYSVLQPCGYVPPYRAKRTINVIPPAGVLHELLFDPVTVGSTVAADATNGVLKPASFTDANGGSATISSISYESSTVKIVVTPDDALFDHIVDIIELDGTVSLSFDDFDATVDSVNGTVSWSVSSQPWDDGDLLMVRIREVPPSCRSRSVVSDAGREPGLVSDCEALLNLREELAGTAALNWSLSTAIESWDGVTVGGTPKRVTELDLASSSLTGMVPAGLGDLTGLERLVFHQNLLTGGIPMELGGLSDLEHMDLSNNSLSDSIPDELGSLSKLEVLYLNSNDLSGAIPTELGNLSELDELVLSGNDLSGPIPAGLGGLTQLTQLWLFDNDLSGAIPSELGGLTSVRVLLLNDNDLSGPIPWELGELTNLLRLDLSGNHFTGCISPSLRTVSLNDLAQLGLPDCTQDGGVPAPGGLSVTLSSGTFTITWNAVMGAAEYEAEYQVSGSADGWAGLPATTGTSVPYSPAGGPACGSTYEFRVRSYGDGTTYVASWGVESGVESVVTEECNEPPEFGAALYEFMVPEDASRRDLVGRVSATDPDAGDTVSYSIASGNGDRKFRIADRTGRIMVAGWLDYEDVASYTLTVEASDGRGGVATVDVEIEVTDVPKDRAPIPDGLEATLTDGTFTIRWNPVEGVTHYAVQVLIIGVQDNWMDIDASVEESSLEYTPTEGVHCGGVEYRFWVWPFGDGVTYVATWSRPGESDYTAVSTGACNQVPEFGAASYDFTVPEDASVDDAVGTVPATDADAGDTVSYSIESGNGDGKFAIGDAMGEITVAGELDYEDVASYTLAVKASDGRGGVATVDVEIAVTYVAEDLPPAPGGLAATLADGTFTITWSAVTGAAEYEAQHQAAPAGGWVYLPATTGTSATYSPMGGPACGTTYEFRVRSYGDGMTYAADWGPESGVESVTTEACNQAPVFGTTSYAFMVSEDASVDALVGTVSATDPDMGDTVSYSVVSGNGDGKFAIDDVTGEITVAGELDYEDVATYTLTVEASDGRGGSATVDVEIEVTDVAEDLALAPGGLSVTLSSGTFTITWNAVTGSSEYEVQHQVSGSTDEWTDLPRTTVTSATYGPTGGALCGTTYEFRVRSYGDGMTFAADWGPESGVEPVTTDECDNPPEFGESVYSFAIAEDAATNTSVGTVTATDPDVGDTLSYSIALGNDDGKFAIGASMGEITVAGELDPDDLAFHVLTVDAVDGYGLTATVKVGIALLLTECSNGSAVPSPSINPLLVRDCSMLLAARDELAGDGSLDWSADTSINDWQAVMVMSPQNGEAFVERVQVVAPASLSGSIPPEVGGLSDLRDLSFAGNDLTGEIPPELGMLMDLRRLSLAYNELTGNIPTELGALVGLQWLLLDKNRLTGEIPAELGGLVNLEALWLSRNRLEGEIPAELGSLASLDQLLLHTNRLTGAIPWQLAVLSALTDLKISVNRLEGCVPPALRRINSNDLANLGLSDCTEEGPAPTPGGLAATLASGTFTITWSAVTGAAEYVVQHRISGSDGDWTSLPATSGTRTTYSPVGDPECGTTYEFRVRSYGDAETYAAGWGPESEAASVMTGACGS